ncbi:50S ribosomal protein L3 [Patescibacteria group bacterium]|nr:50S ribosomal protein L3 [Patescibacteria group bacterium]
MAKFILGKKLGMTRVFDKSGKLIPVTVIEAGPCVITQVKTEKKDRYNAVQIGFGKAKKISKPKAGLLKKLGMLKHLKEFAIKDIASYKVGDKIDVSIFSEGDIVKASGITKAKGFAGVMKRHGFAGGPASHGQKHSARERGSVGPRFPEHVVKGVRMPGRMGGARSTVINLPVLSIDKENNLIALKGAIPGKKGTLIEVVSINSRK